MAERGALRDRRTGSLSRRGSSFVEVLLAMTIMALVLVGILQMFSVSLEKTLILEKNAIEARRLRHENLDLRKQLQAKIVIVGDSVPVKALRQQIALMAPDRKSTRLN